MDDLEKLMSRVDAICKCSAHERTGFRYNFKKHQFELFMWNAWNTEYGQTGQLMGVAFDPPNWMAKEAAVRYISNRCAQIIHSIDKKIWADKARWEEDNKG